MRRLFCLLLSLVLAGVLLSYVVPASAVPTVAAGRPVAGVWRWPLDGTPRVTRRFDPPDTPYGPGHRGVDLAGRPGEVVRAAGAGRVGYAGVLAGRGVVTVRHPDGLKTTYEPVSASVHAGQPVAIGAVLGRLQPGHLGCPVSACLHWGLLRGNAYLDPLSLLGQGRVRLLPLHSDPVAGANAYSDSIAPEPPNHHFPSVAALPDPTGVPGPNHSLRCRDRRKPRATPQLSPSCSSPARSSPDPAALRTRSSP